MPLLLVAIVAVACLQLVRSARGLSDLDNADTSSAIDTRFITDIGSVADRMLILMDIEGLVASEEIGLLISPTECRIPPPADCTPTE